MLFDGDADRRESRVRSVDRLELSPPGFDAPITARISQIEKPVKLEIAREKE